MAKNTLLTLSSSRPLLSLRNTARKLAVQILETAAVHSEQRLPNWWVASRFVVGREKFLKCDFINYIKIKNDKKRKS
jgi:hypothetical protein